MSKKIAFLTLGCKVNMYDTEAMRELFEKRGYESVDFDSPADVYLINTCTVTNLGDKKSRQMIRRARRLNPNAVVVAAGCYAQVAPEEVAAIEGVNIVIGTKDRLKAAELVERYSSETGVVNAVSSLKEERAFEPLEISRLSDRTRAFIKIQEGCNRYCSYCIIPYARGPIRSRKPDEIISEIERLAANGFKEIVLTGIHIASYGLDIGGIALADIIERVNEVDGIERIRFSSMEPLAVTEDFIAEIKAMPKVCPHFHLSLQSGCDKTLKHMNRRYSTDEYRTVCTNLRAAFSDAALTTDVIVGFPGESDRDFDESMTFCKSIHLDKIHVFPYSPKRGTPAADYPEQVPPEVKARRAELMGKLSDKMNIEFMSGYIGEIAEVLFEDDVKGISVGHTRNYIRVEVLSDKLLHNTLQRVRLTEIIRPETMRGELV